MHPQWKMHDDQDYLQWVREQPSIVSEAPPPSDPHHVWNTGKRKAGKINDYLAVPLTRQEHTDYHQMGHDSFEKKYNVSLEWEIINLLSKYISEGK